MHKADCQRPEVAQWSNGVLGNLRLLAGLAVWCPRATVLFTWPCETLGKEFRRSLVSLHDADCARNLIPAFVDVLVRGGADKSLARRGKKQATMTKLLIYSTYSPRSSIHFLACCSNFCKPLKKIQKFVRPTRSALQQ